MLCAACQRRVQGLKKRIPGNRLSFLLHRLSRSSSSSASSPPVETAVVVFFLKGNKGVCLLRRRNAFARPTTYHPWHTPLKQTQHQKKIFFKKTTQKTNTINLTSRGSGAETRLTTAAGASANCCTLLNRAASLRNIVTLFALPQHLKKKRKRERGGGGAAG